MLHHLGVERSGDGGGLSAVSEVILKAALDHVVVVQPAVGAHHVGLLVVQNLKEFHISSFW